MSDGAGNKKEPTPTFVGEFPLSTTASDESTLDKRFRAGLCLRNAVQGEALRRLTLMRQSKDWQKARAMPRHLGVDKKDKQIPNKERTALFKIVRDKFNFDKYSLQKYAEKTRDSCWIGDHLGSHDTQILSLRAFMAVQLYAFGKIGRPRFKNLERFRSISGKANVVIRYKAEPVPAVHWNGLVMPLMLDPKDMHGWQAHALSQPVKFIRIIRKKERGKIRYYGQIVLGGNPLIKRAIGKGEVGLDIGIHDIAIVGDNIASLEQLCPTINKPYADVRRTQRAMERSRRSTNPHCYAADGTWIKGHKITSRSTRYQEKRIKLSDKERRLACERKRSHGELSNIILSIGTRIRTERISHKAWQKTFGRSVGVRAPGMLMASITRKAERAGGETMLIDTHTTRLSQFDHTTEDYVKKPRGLDIHHFRDGMTDPVQRDLYSAYLARHCSPKYLDISSAQQHWTRAEPLVRQAMSRTYKLARRQGLPLPHLITGVTASRLPKK